jgi:hypothetical protein
MLEFVKYVGILEMIHIISYCYKSITVAIVYCDFCRVNTHCTNDCLAFSVIANIFMKNISAIESIGDTNRRKNRN